MESSAWNKLAWGRQRHQRNTKILQKMTSNFNFTVTSWFLGNICVKPYFNTQWEWGVARRTKSLFYGTGLLSTFGDNCPPLPQGFHRPWNSLLRAEKAAGKNLWNLGQMLKHIFFCFLCKTTTMHRDTDLFFLFSFFKPNEVKNGLASSKNRKGLSLKL